MERFSIQSHQQQQQQPHYEAISPPTSCSSSLSQQQHKKPAANAGPKQQQHKSAAAATTTPSGERGKKRGIQKDALATILESDLLLSEEDVLNTIGILPDMQPSAPNSPTSYYHYFPTDSQASLVQMWESSEQDYGIQVTIVGRGHKFVSAHNPAKVKHITTSVEETERLVAFQVARPGHAFMPLESDPTSVLMLHSQYLELLKFMAGDWVHVRSKLVSDCQQLSDGNKLAWLQGSVYFRGEGGANHTYQIGKTRHGDVLDFVTSAVLNKTTNPPSIQLSCTLCYKLATLGSLTFNPQPLINLSRDIPILSDYLVYKGRPTIIQHQPGSSL